MVFVKPQLFRGFCWPVGRSCLRECACDFDNADVPGLVEAKRTKIVDAQADPIIEYAIRLKDWPMLEEAVGKKLDEQTEYVRWWRETVDKGPTTLPARLKSLLSLPESWGRYRGRLVTLPPPV